MNKKLTKYFLFFMLPCLYFWFLFCYSLLGNFEFHTVGFLKTLTDGVIFIANLLIDFNNDFYILTIMQLLFAMFVIWPLEYIGVGLMILMFLVLIPYFMFVDGFYLSNLLVWVGLIISIFAIVGTFKFGSYIDNPIYEKGSHYEAEIQSDGKVKITEEKDYGGGGGYFLNGWLFLFKFIAIIAGGAIIFLIKLIKSKNNNAD